MTEPIAKDAVPAGPSLGTRLLWALAALAAIALPLSLLFDPAAGFYPPFDWSNHFGRAGYYGDWANHLWMIGYFGEYFRHHLTMPTEFNTAPGVGMAGPMFYGYLLYPLLGIPSSVMGPALALRLACAALLAVQFWAMVRCGWVVFGHRPFAYAVAVTLLWSVYSLTNLYNRSAIPEFFAAGFVVTAVSLAVSAGASSGPRQNFDAWLACVFSVLAIGAHPPTAVVAAPFLAVLAAVLLPSWWRGRKPPAARAAVAGALAWAGLVLAPWVYLNLTIGRKLAIWRPPHPLAFHLNRSDTWLERLYPGPYDHLSVERGTAFLMTPYLEAPIAFGLVIALAWCLAVLWRSRRTQGRLEDGGGNGAAKILLGVGAFWAVFLLVFSLWQPLADATPFLGPLIQFAYRLVAPANAALLLAVFAAGALAARRGAFTALRHEADLVSAVVLAIAALGLAQKLPHAAAVERPVEERDFGLGAERAALVTEGRPILNWQYATPSLARPLNPAEIQGAVHADFPVDSEGADFGRVKETRVSVARSSWVITNALAFSWAGIQVDGCRLEGPSLARQDSLLAVRLPPGEHRLTWEWRPDPCWTGLHWLSRAALYLGILFTIGWAAQDRRTSS